MEQSGAHSTHSAFLCSGESWDAHGGSWIGHLLPGLVMLAWGLHWFSSATYQAVTGVRKQPAGASHHLVVFLPGVLQHVEPVLKVVFPVIAIALEFGLSGTRYLRCPPGTAKAGELDIRHMNSWSHSTNYPPIILSGLVDLTHTYITPLPPGVPQGVLSAAFGTSAFLMLSHTKADPLDALLHRLMGYCMVAVAVTVLLQVAVRGQSFAVNAAKSLAMIMEGCWFLAITHIMFTDDITWKASHPGDMSRLMFTPVLFAWIFIGALTFLLVLYISMHALLSGRQHSGLSSKQHAVEEATNCGSCGSCGCESMRGRRPWKYLVLPQGGKQHTSNVPAEDEGSCESSSDTSIEMV